MILPQDFFDLNEFDHREIFSAHEAVWKALDRLHDYLMSFFGDPWPLSKITGQIERPLVIHSGEVRDDLEVTTGGSEGSVQVYMKGEPVQGAAVILPGAYLFNDRVILGPGTVVEPGALIKGPIVIGKDTEIRQGAYIRGGALAGNGCIIGHTTEIKGSIMLNGAKAGHFAYVGDSILGGDVNLGAGTKLANLKMIPGTILIHAGKKHHDTGRRKLGAILGDHAETGCNSVTSPGTLLGPRSLVYPCMCVPAGCYPGRAILMPPKDSLKVHNSGRK